MNCPECRTRLHDHVDGQLPASETRLVAEHLACCEACRVELASLQRLLASARALPREIAPASDLWPRLAASLERRPEPVQFAPLRWLVSVGVAAIVVLGFTLAERASLPEDDGWAVATLAGEPRVGRRQIQGGAQLRLGQWLETDAASRAKLQVGAIGELRLEPNSRLRLTGTGTTDHRVQLTRGQMHALIWAPPRLFFVDTPSARAIDLGCSYTLTVDDRGDGELHVLTGYVALEHGHREAIVPEGMMCLTRKNAGPGTPFVARAPAALREALSRFDFEGGPAGDVLALAGREDAVTLWHLLARTTGQERATVFDRLAMFYAPPAGVTREGIVQGDVAMRDAWADVLALRPLTAP